MRKSCRDIKRLTYEMKKLRLAYTDLSKCCKDEIDQDLQETIAAIIYRFKSLSVIMEARMNDSKDSVKRVKTYKRAFTQGYFKRMPQHGHYIDKLR